MHVTTVAYSEYNDLVELQQMSCGALNDVQMPARWQTFSTANRCVFYEERRMATILQCPPPRLTPLPCSFLLLEHKPAETCSARID